MKIAIFVAAMIAQAGPGMAAQIPDALKAEMACTGQTITEATRGDFSNWTLPDFIPGKHRRAADGLAPCMPKTANPWR